MKTKTLRIFLLIAMLFSALTPAAQVTAQTESASSKGVSPVGMLNPDGTLNLSGDFNGALDLAGYSVQMDPKRGPIFGPALTGQWSGMGYGGNTFNGFVNAIAVIGRDVYVGGNFTDADNIPTADYIAKWDGIQWSAVEASINTALNGMVTSLAVDGSNLYVGGQFTNAGGNGLADYVVRWNGSWTALGSDGAGDGSLKSWVNALAFTGTTLYVGGKFTNVNNAGTVLPTADYIARWNGSQWSAIGSNGAGNGVFNQVVYALAVDGSGNLYAGGAFTNANSATADYVAKWNGVSWNALGGFLGNGSVNNIVSAIAVSGSNVYIGGAFTDVNSILSADHVAKWNGSWMALGNNGAGDGSLNNNVEALMVVGSYVYIGGWFTDVSNGGSTLANADYIATWDGTNWAAVGSGSGGNGSINDGVLALAVGTTQVYAGGTFTSVNNNGTNLTLGSRLAVWNGTYWSGVSQSPTSSSLNGQVYAVLVNGTDVYVGGQFVDVNNNGTPLPTADYIAKWNGTSWSALGSNGMGNGAINGSVYALAMDDAGRLFVGGNFVNASNISVADYLAVWDGTWSAVGTSALNNPVMALAASETSVYVGGWFINAGGLAPADYIAKWDGSNWSALGNNGSGNGALNDVVDAIAVSGTNLYVGGHFTNASNKSAADYIAKWNGSGWSALGCNFIGDGSLNNAVYAIAVSGSDVYVGGDFTDVNTYMVVLTEADYVAKWDGSGWSALGSNGAGNGAIANIVWSIAVNGADVYIGGSFKNVNNNGAVIPEADYIAKWNGANWSALGSDGDGNGSLNNYVNVLTKSGSALYVGGGFTSVNNNGAAIPSADYVAIYGINTVGTSTIYLPLVLR
jgi:stage V sporulation protein SpoVS